MTITEKVAHLKGLMEGLAIDDSSKEGKVLNYIADILEDMAMSVADLEDQTDDLNGYIEEIDEDLAVLEDDFYEDYQGQDDLDDEYDDELDSDDIGEFYQVNCPTCSEPVFLDNSIDPSRVICPSCHAEFSGTTQN